MEKKIENDTTTVAVFKKTRGELALLAAKASILAGEKVSIKQLIKELVDKAKKDEAI